MAKHPHVHERPTSFFHEIEGSGRFVPRTIFVDSDPASLNSIREKRFGELFSPDCFVGGTSSTGNIFAKGKYTTGAELLDPVLELVRREAESCDRLQGFQLVHSLGGGTGSGLGSLLLEKLREEYPGTILASHAIKPSLDRSDVVVEPYNAVLAFNDLIEHADQCFLYSNSALQEAHQHLLHQSSTTFNDLNHLIARSMNIITSGTRFPGPDVFGMRKLAMSTVPFPRLHFLMPSLAPLSTAAEKRYDVYTVHDILERLFNPWHSLCRVHGSSTNGTVYVTAACIFRGFDSAVEIEEQILKYTSRHSHEFVDYIPNNIAVSAVRYTEVDSSLSGVMLANSSGTLISIIVQSFE